MRREVHARALHQRVAQHAAAVARDEPAHHRADDVKLAVAREQRAGQHAGDNAEVVDAPRHRQHGRISEQVLQQRFHLAPRFSAREQGRRTPARSPTPRPPAKRAPAPPRPGTFRPTPAAAPEVAARPAAANLIGRHAAAVKRRNPLPACSAAKQARMRSPKQRRPKQRSHSSFPRAESPSPRQQQPNAFRQAKANAAYSPAPFTLISPASTLNRQRPERILRCDDARRPQRDGTHKSPNFQPT